MKKTILAVLMTTALLSGSADALDVPTKSRSDGRIQYVDYKANDVTRINAVNGYITTITFSPGETVVNYGSGYSTAWEFAASENHFFLKPKDKNGTTNLVIVTNKHVYSIDVHLVTDDKKATYQLLYRYPAEAAMIAENRARQKAIDNELNKDDPNLLEERPLGNYQYTMNFGKDKGSEALAPTLVFDDNNFTYFKFQSQRDFPAIYRVTPDGESMVNYHVEKGVLIVHGVFPEFRLRAGKAVVGIYNENYQGGSLVPSSGTTIKGIEREVNK